jgi:hypothetical protein
MGKTVEERLECMGIHDLLVLQKLINDLLATGASPSDVLELIDDRLPKVIKKKDEELYRDLLKDEGLYEDLVYEK